MDKLLNDFRDIKLSRDPYDIRMDNLKANRVKSINKLTNWELGDKTKRGYNSHLEYTHSPYDYDNSDYINSLKFNK